MRRRISRRSVSICVSPGPRTPMAPGEPLRPPRRSRWLHWPLRRGRRYSVCANSTCRRPSRVRARTAKMSRISAVRIEHLHLQDALQAALLCWRELVIEQHHAVAIAVAARLDFFELSLPHVGRGMGGRESLDDAAYYFRAAVSASSSNSSSERSSLRPSRPCVRSTPTSSARSGSAAVLCICLGIGTLLPLA